MKHDNYVFRYRCKEGASKASSLLVISMLSNTGFSHESESLRCYITELLSCIQTSKSSY